MFKEAVEVLKKQVSFEKEVYLFRFISNFQLFHENILLPLQDKWQSLNIERNSLTFPTEKIQTYFCELQAAEIAADQKKLFILSSLLEVSFVELKDKLDSKDILNFKWSTLNNGYTNLEVNLKKSAAQPEHSADKNTVPQAVKIQKKTKSIRLSMLAGLKITERDNTEKAEDKKAEQKIQADRKAEKMFRILLEKAKIIFARFLAMISGKINARPLETGTEEEEVIYRAA